MATNVLWTLHNFTQPFYEEFYEYLKKVLIKFIHKIMARNCNATKLCANNLSLLAVASFLVENGAFARGDEGIINTTFMNLGSHSSSVLVVNK